MQRHRRGIFVVTVTRDIPSSVRSGILFCVKTICSDKFSVAPLGRVAIWMRSLCYKYPVPHGGLDLSIAQHHRPKNLEI